MPKGVITTLDEQIDCPHCEKGIRIMVEKTNTKPGVRAEFETTVHVEKAPKQARLTESEPESDKRDKK